MKMNLSPDPDALEIRREMRLELRRKPRCSDFLDSTGTDEGIRPEPEPREGDEE